MQITQKNIEIKGGNICKKKERKIQKSTKRKNQKNQDRNGSMEIHQQGKKEENMYTKQITVEKQEQHFMTLLQGKGKR